MVGSLTSTFVLARHVRLAIKLAYAFARPVRFPSGPSQPLNSFVTFWKDNAPLKLPIRHCPATFLPSRLDFKIRKMAVSLAGPWHPKTPPQPLPPTLPLKNL